MAATIDARGVLADHVPGERARDVALVAMYAVFVGLTAQVSIPPSGVP